MIFLFYEFISIEFRLFLAGLTSLLFSAFFLPKWITFLKKFKLKQYVRDNGPQTHLVKEGTPTMGGFAVIMSVLFSLLLWGNWENMHLQMTVVTLILFAGIGALDDLLKIKKMSYDGISGRKKYTLQSIIALAIALYFYQVELSNYHMLSFPFVDYSLEIGVLSIILSYFVIVGVSNSVNLTDGLDGLVTVPVIFTILFLAICAYVSSDLTLASTYQLPYLPMAQELLILSIILIMSLVVFLWHNSYPAQIFMGDTGSLALGAVIGVMAILLRQEIILLIVGFIFVIETVSVILQVTSFRLRKKRIFRMAPLHHHFELLGWHENKVVLRFWIISFLCFCIALVSLLI